MNAEAYFSVPNILELRNRIARYWAESWKVTWQPDVAPETRLEK
jgi:hypothetical protein